MSVPAFLDELATSSLTTRAAQGMADSSPHSPITRVTKSRDARGAVGCGESSNRSTMGVGTASTSEIAENKDGDTIR